MVSHLSSVNRPVLILCFVLLGQKLWVHAGFQSHVCLFQVPSLMVMTLFLKNGLIGLVETKEHRKWRDAFVLPLLGRFFYCLDLENKPSY